VQRPFAYLQAVARLMDSVQEIHRTTPAIAPLTNAQVHLWLQQVTLEDLDAAGQLPKSASATSSIGSND
jgi:hypothetical protein